MTSLKKSGKKAGNSFNQDQLDRALISVYELFDRAACPFFLLGETARSIYKDGVLKGNEIEIGIKDKHATKEVFSTLNTILGDLELLMEDTWEVQEKGVSTKYFLNLRDDAKKIRFMSEDVPVTVKIIRKKSRFLDNLDNIVYAFDDYKIPNPFNDYYKVRGLIR